MGVWTIADEYDVCGYDGRPIPKGRPMQLLGPQTMPQSRWKKRCEEHRHGEVNWSEVDQARQAAEQLTERDALAAEAAPSPLPPRRVPRPPKSFASMRESAGALFDSKAAAAHDVDHE